jgi:hypothetical protein
MYGYIDIIYTLYIYAHIYIYVYIVAEVHVQKWFPSICLLCKLLSAPYISLLKLAELGTGLASRHLYAHEALRPVTAPGCRTEIWSPRARGFGIGRGLPKKGCRTGFFSMGV